MSIRLEPNILIPTSFLPSRVTNVLVSL